MSVSGGIFRWLDILEAEFDRAHVEVDLALRELEPDEYNLAANIREKLATLCATFTQLSEKAQSIFQNNCRLEAQLYSLREDVTEARTQCSLIDSERRQLLFEVHEAQLQHPATQQQDAHQAQRVSRSLGDGKVAVSEKRASDERLRAENTQLSKENVQLRQWLMDTESELFAALLAARYLDKELAGRIQQIQLLARDLRPEDHDRLWSQLEAEINLHRHKTITQACRQRGRRRHTGGSARTDRQRAQVERSVAGIVREVEIFKGAGQSLGLTITGGQEHGVPVVISEIQDHHLAAQSGAFLVGDAILAVNGVDLRSAKHSDAVKVLCQLSGNITFELLYVSGDSDSEDEADGEGFVDPEQLPVTTGPDAPYDHHNGHDAHYYADLLVKNGIRQQRSDSVSANVFDPHAPSPAPAPHPTANGHPGAGARPRPDASYAVTSTHSSPVHSRSPSRGSVSGRRRLRFPGRAFPVHLRNTQSTEIH
ncbi:Golgi-associated PDZ and coiled-coil motif-containing protein-like [Paramacrobiotus metropolitanus]|uniref:Golgi-associated PDZ and coiled-coil motif-containing protein-like n=1 Tax=Paramacrobiotus metropolitanus TaxID=2943436 RepID=UPI002445AEA1|nr:Golgi-associated PDZ and coiled-coil motif-containing protein-like [Paramacrobiotus metropolitanus]